MAGEATFDKGFALGARVEHNAARKAIARAALDILGKDAADGWVDLGALGTWGISWQGATVESSAARDAR